MTLPRWFKYMLYGHTNMQKLDKLAQARPIHQNFEDLAKDLSNNNK